MKLLALMRRFQRNISGAIAPMTAMLLIPILGTTALAVDAGYWYFKQRDMQNAADSAALAGAQTADEDSGAAGYDGANDDFIKVAKGAAAKYGYVDGQGSVIVIPTRVPCPADASEQCTQVQIDYDSPLFFSPIVGFSGNKSGGSQQGVAALAIAGDTGGGGTTYEFCMLSLESTPGVNGILANGVPHADLNGCDIFSNSDLQCNGHNLNAGTAIAVGSSSVCGGTQVSNADFWDDPDPYDTLASNIPADPCGGNPSNYPVASKQGNSYTSSQSKNRWPSGLSLVNATANGEKIFCGDVILNGPATVTDTPIIIYNGRLITNGNKFTGNHSPVIFSGTNNANYSHYPTDVPGNSNVKGSTIEISAPTSGPWSGVAIYLDPNLTQNVDIDQSGNSPALNLTGLFYAPHSHVEFSGVVNKAGTGYNCFVLVGNTIRIDGTGQIYADAQRECDDAGLVVPTLGVGGRPWLVY